MNSKLKILYISNGLFTFAGHLLIPMFSLLVIGSGGSIGLAGFLFGIQFLASTLASLCVIQIKDKQALDHRMLEFNYFARAIAWMILAFNQSIPILITVQIVVGITNSIGSPAFSSLVSENLDKKHHLKDWGIWDITINSVSAGASILSGFIITAYGFPMLFALMSGLGFMAYFFLLANRKQFI